MKKLCVLLILVAVAMAVNTRIQTVLPPLEEKIDINRPALNLANNNAPFDYMPVIGRVETVGWTFYDWWFNGPSYTNCRVDAVANGIHVSWMYQLGSDPRNTRYNFYDFSTSTWNWPNTGVNVYSISTGFGGMDYDPITGHAVICAHGSVGGILTPVVARDISPGTGLFEYSNAPSNNLWPPVAVSNNQAIHIAMTNNIDRDSLWYSRGLPWGTWSTPVRVPESGAAPMFPTQNIHASKTSNKVVAGWQCSEDLYPKRMFYRLSNDGGVNWLAQTQVPFPPSYGGITPGYHISSFFAMFDNSDNLRIVAAVSDTGFTLPAQIWMYSPHLANPWTLVHHYDAETLAAAVGYNAIFACRPQVTQASNGNFYVAWEQFDSLNYEPVTSLARADIHVAELTNNGQTVSRKGRITDPDNFTKRFPCIGGVKNDTLILMYQIDSVAGFGPTQGQGPTTNNPVVVHRLHVNSIPIAIEEQPPVKTYEFTLNAQPNPFHNNARIAYSVPTTGDVNLTVYDILGRPVKTLVSGTQSAGNYTAIWNGRTNTNEIAKAGVYFYTLKTSDRQISRKIIKTN
ncbi:MAG: T9SS type A sorting domain-containing protein [Candidatus Latescibacteria bacterium]|nr:T9SS type A sorting domain-containing protein [Candidatus Latescibacterota bacterium]